MHKAELFVYKNEFQAAVNTLREGKALARQLLEIVRLEKASAEVLIPIHRLNKPGRYRYRYSDEAINAGETNRSPRDNFNYDLKADFSYWRKEKKISSLEELSATVASLLSVALFRLSPNEPEVYSDFINVLIGDNKPLNL